MSDTRIEAEPAIRYIDSWLDQYSAFVPPHVIDFALDVRRLVEDPNSLAGGDEADQRVTEDAAMPVVNEPAAL